MKAKTILTSAALLIASCGTTQTLPHASSTQPAHGTKTSAKTGGVLAPEASAGPVDEKGEATETAAANPSSDRYYDAMTVEGQRAHGLYFTGPYVKLLGAAGVIRTIKANGMNAAVIDLKDDQGRITYDSQIPLLQNSKKPLLGDAKALFKEIKDAGIYVIGRVVCFNDPILPRAYPDRAVIDNRPKKKGKAWISWGTGNTWLDPSNPANQKLIADIADEAQHLGIDELQLDYIRFPVDDGTQFAIFPSYPEGKKHLDILMNILRQVDETLHIPLSADVFGLTALKEGDPAGLGQSLGDWVAYVEAFSPMLYINAYQRWENKVDGTRAASLLWAAISTLRKRIGDRPVIRPFMQAFEEGSDQYDDHFFISQIRAAKEAGADGFLFWHPGSNYKPLSQAMRAGGRNLYPFNIDHRIPVRAKPPSADSKQGGVAAKQSPAASHSGT